MREPHALDDAGVALRDESGPRYERRPWNRAFLVPNRSGAAAQGAIRGHFLHEMCWPGRRGGVEKSVAIDLRPLTRGLTVDAGGGALVRAAESSFVCGPAGSELACAPPRRALGGLCRQATGRAVAPRHGSRAARRKKATSSLSAPPSRRYEERSRRFLLGAKGGVTAGTVPAVIGPASAQHCHRRRLCLVSEGK